MEQTQVDTCCDLGVKGSCATCDFSVYCNGKWSHATSQGSSAESLKYRI